MTARLSKAAVSGGIREAGDSSLESQVSRLRGFEASNSEVRSSDRNVERKMKKISASCINNTDTSSGIYS